MDSNNESSKQQQSFKIKRRRSHQRDEQLVHYEYNSQTNTAVINGTIIQLIKDNDKIIQKL